MAVVQIAFLEKLGEEALALVNSAILANHRRNKAATNTASVDAFKLKELLSSAGKAATKSPTGIDRTAVEAHLATVTSVDELREMESGIVQELSADDKTWMEERLAHHLDRLTK